MCEWFGSDVLALVSIDSQDLMEEVSAEEVVHFCIFFAGEVDVRGSDERRGGSEQRGHGASCGGVAGAAGIQLEDGGIRLVLVMVG